LILSIRIQAQQHFITKGGGKKKGGKLGRRLGKAWGRMADLVRRKGMFPHRMGTGGGWARGAEKIKKSRRG